MKKALIWGFAWKKSQRKNIQKFKTIEIGKPNKRNQSTTLFETAKVK